MRSNRKIVFINQATGYLTIDIINAFAAAFNNVALITGSIRVQDTHPDPAIKISKITRYNRGNTFQKALSWFTGTIQVIFLLMFRYRQYEKIFFTIPPTAYLFAPMLRSSYSIVIYDLYPEALKAYGFRESGLIYRWWGKRNIKVFRNAHRIYTLSENMKSLILKYDGSIDVRVISNWSAFSDKIPVKKTENRIVNEEGLTGKFIIQYSGNIGVTHNVESLIEVAEALKEHSDLLFIIIGRGKRIDDIRKIIAAKELKNCRVFPFLSDEFLYESLCSADLSVVTLDEKTPDISIPSKIYNIMSSGVPIMAISPVNSGISRILKKYGAGITFTRNDISGMCEFIIKLKSKPAIWKMYAENSMKASMDFTKANASKYLEYYK